MVFLRNDDDIINFDELNDRIKLFHDFKKLKTLIHLISMFLNLKM